MLAIKAERLKEDTVLQTKVVNKINNGKKVTFKFESEEDKIDFLEQSCKLATEVGFVAGSAIGAIAGTAIGGPIGGFIDKFDSVAVKEPKFEIDGVFLPPENQSPGAVYFCEVQFQKDERLYERVFAESSLYFYRNRDRFNDWQVVIIYPSRNTEQSDIYPHRGQLNSPQVRRVYLNELGNIRELPVWVALMVLTTVEEQQAPEEARYLISRSSTEQPETRSQVIIDLITTIIAYRFEQLSRSEVEEMLGITLKETRMYQDIKEEGKEEGREEGKVEGREVEARSLILRQLNRRVGELPQEIRQSVETLSLEQLENLGEALLDFNSMADLQTWLEQVKG